MYSHVIKAKFIRIEVNRKTFNKIFARKTEEITLKKNNEWRKKLAEENEFIRLIHGDWYMDVSIRKTVLKTEYIVHIGDILDCNRHKGRQTINKQK